MSHRQFAISRRQSPWNRRIGVSAHRRNLRLSVSPVLRFPFPCLLLAAYCLLVVPSSAAAQPPPDTTTVSGTVCQADGVSPAVGATVTLRRVGLMTGDPTFWGTSVTTDENGRFVVPEVEEGQYQLTIALTDCPPLTRSLDVRARAMENLTFRLVSFSRISGTILCPDGKPAAFHGNIILTLNRTDGDVADVITRRVTMDARGKFQLDQISPGSYVVMAYAIGEGFGTSKTLTVKEGEDYDGVTIRLRRSTPDAAAVASAPGRTSMTAADVSLLVDSTASPAPPPPMATAAPRPLLTISDAVPRQSVAPPRSTERTDRVEPPRPTALDAAFMPPLPSLSTSFPLRQSGSDGGEKRITVGAPSGGVQNFWLPRSSGVLTGRVLRSRSEFSNLPLYHAVIFVTLEPLDERDSFSPGHSHLSPLQCTLVTDEYGLFLLRFLPLGRYRVRVRAPEWGESVEIANVKPHATLRPSAFFILRPLSHPTLDRTPCDNKSLSQRRQKAEGRRQWSMVNGQWSVVSGQWSVVSGQRTP